MAHKKYSRLIGAALDSDRNVAADLYYEDDWGMGMLAVVRFEGTARLNQQWQLGLVNPKWTLAERMPGGTVTEETLYSLLLPIYPGSSSWFQLCPSARTLRSVNFLDQSIYE